MVQQRWTALGPHVPNRSQPTRFAAQVGVLGGSRAIPLARHASDLHRAQWLDRAALDLLRAQRLGRLLTHARMRCPYYREVLGPAGSGEGGTSLLDRLAELPTLERGHVRERLDDLVDEAADRRAMVRLSTGGTTGAPMAFYVNQEYRRHSRALCARLYSTLGRNPFSSTLILAGSPIDVERWGTWVRKIQDGLRRTSTIPAFDITQDSVPSIISRIRRRRPRFLMGYTSSLDLLARHLIAAGETAPVGTVVPLAEMVTTVHRQHLSDAFTGRVCEIYGAREASAIAAECAHQQGMHIQEDAYIVEVLQGDRRVEDGTPGEIVITDLFNYAMPLIRYRIGDVGVIVPEECRCGRTFSCLKITHGRVLDVVVTRAGALLPGEYFPHLFKEVERDVAAFSVHQRSLDRIDIELVVRGEPGEGLESYLAKHILAKVGADVEIRFQRVNQLTREASGKFRPTRSDVPLPW